MGDGLMAIHKGKSKKDNALNATRSALAILETTSRFNQELEGRFDPITINIGISSGIAAVGVTKFASLGGERWTYTATGPISNLASRLCSATEEGSILIDEETAKRVNKDIEIRKLGKRQFKNIGTFVSVFMAVRELSSKHSR